MCNICIYNIYIYIYIYIGFAYVNEPYTYAYITFTYVGFAYVNEPYGDKGFYAFKIQDKRQYLVV